MVNLARIREIVTNYKFWCDLSIALAVFRPVCRVALSYLGLNSLSLILPELLLVGATIGTLFNQRFRLSEIHSLDVWMFGWLLFFPYAFIQSSYFVDSPFEIMTHLRLFFLVPSAYFAFRIVNSGKDWIELVPLLDMLFKICVLYILSEAILLNIFHLRELLESVFLRNQEARLYDSVFGGRWIRPAGPIHGVQNASILCLIAVLYFSEVFIKHRNRNTSFWLLLSVAAFLAVVTMTALLSGMIWLMIRSMVSDRWHLRWLVVISLIGVICFLSFFWKEIIAFRVSGTLSDNSYLVYQDAGISAIKDFLNELNQSFFGTGWPGTRSSSQDLYALSVWKRAPDEIFFLRLGVFLGFPFLLYFSIFHLYLIISIMNKSKKTVFNASSALPVIVAFCLFMSTIHYESFLASGFSFLYGATLLGVEIKPKPTERSINDDKS